MANRMLGLFALLSALLALTGSASASNQIREIRVEAGQNINQDLPVALDIVFVYDAGVRSSLPTDASLWFSNRSLYRTSFGRAFDVLSLELVPGTSLEVMPGPGGVPQHSGQAQEVRLYTNYLDPRGHKPQLLPNLTCVAISLGATEASVGSC